MTHPLWRSNKSNVRTTTHMPQWRDNRRMEHCCLGLITNINRTSTKVSFPQQASGAIRCHYCHCTLPLSPSCWPSWSSIFADWFDTVCGWPPSFLIHHSLVPLFPCNKHLAPITATTAIVHGFYNLPVDDTNQVSSQIKSILRAVSLPGFSSGAVRCHCHPPVDHPNQVSSQFDSTLCAAPFPDHPLF